jgi:hypothetical protein
VQIAKSVVGFAEPVGFIPFAAVGKVETKRADPFGLNLDFSGDSQKLPRLRNASNVTHIDGIGFLPNLLFQ